MYNGCATLGTTLYTLHTHKRKRMKWRLRNKTKDLNYKQKENWKSVNHNTKRDTENKLKW